MQHTIWVRLKGMESKDFQRRLSKIISNMKIEGVEVGEKNSSPVGLEDTPTWIEIGFTSFQTLLQLLGVISAFASLKVAKNAIGKNAKTISEGAEKEEIKCVVDEICVSSNNTAKIVENEQ